MVGCCGGLVVLVVDHHCGWLSWWLVVVVVGCHGGWCHGGWSSWWLVVVTVVGPGGDYLRYFPVLAVISSFPMQ